MEFEGDFFLKHRQWAEEVMKSDTISTYKRHLDWHMDLPGIEGYRPNAGK